MNKIFEIGREPMERLRWCSWGTSLYYSKETLMFEIALSYCLFRITSIRADSCNLRLVRLRWATIAFRIIHVFNLEISFPVWRYRKEVTQREWVSKKIGKVVLVSKNQEDADEYITKKRNLLHTLLFGGDK